MADLIEVEGVSKAFGGIQALSGCDLEVHEGAINGLIGPNGSGKTTLFNVITGYERIQQGEVRFNGTRDHERPAGPRLQARHRAHVPAHPALRAPVGAREHARRHAAPGGLAARRAAPCRLGEREDAGDGAARLRRHRRLAHEPAGNLSYGQRKLLELASLLVADPAMLLLDEPAGGVNPTLISHLADRIKELNRAGKTILVVEHNMEFVMGLCARITVLDQGSTLVSGTPAEVRSDPAVLDAYLGGEGRSVERDRAQPTRLAEVAGRGDAGPPPRRASAWAAHRRCSACAGSAPATAAATSSRRSRSTCPRAASPASSGPTAPASRRCWRRSAACCGRGWARSASAAPAHSGLSPSQILARGISQIPQAHSLFPEMTVRENVEMGAFTVSDARLVRQRLAAVEELFPIVYERADEKAGSLSGGQQRLVEFARCLMLDPQLIMLDEPSMGLDPQTRRLVFEMIELMNRQGKTILLVEQNARAGLKLSSHGVVLENGLVRLSGLRPRGARAPRDRRALPRRRDRHRSAERSGKRLHNLPMRTSVTIRDVARLAEVHPGHRVAGAQRADPRAGQPRDGRAGDASRRRSSATDPTRSPAG